jgi:ABC-type molybdate transport system substrate-binding protein
VIRALALMSALVAANVHAQSIDVFAAGSLRAPLTEIARDFERAGGKKVQGTFGASGLLRARIAGGEHADVFASANLEHPQSLAARGWATDVKTFARNRMCLVAQKGSPAAERPVLDVLLDPAVKLGTSTPLADPSGDYAWEVFKLADKVRPGAYATLDAKAQRLTGGPNTPPPPTDRSVYAALVGDKTVDVFLTYCTNAQAASEEDRKLVRIDLPANLEVATAYGIAVRRDAPRAAQDFAAYVLSPEGQRVLARYGFAPP